MVFSSSNETSTFLTPLLIYFKQWWLYSETSIFPTSIFGGKPMFKGKEWHPYPTWFLTSTTYYYFSITVLKKKKRQHKKLLSQSSWHLAYFYYGKIFFFSYYRIIFSPISFLLFLYSSICPWAKGLHHSSTGANKETQRMLRNQLNFKINFMKSRAETTFLKSKRVGHSKVRSWRGNDFSY